MRLAVVAAMLLTVGCRHSPPEVQAYRLEVPKVSPDRPRGVLAVGCPDAKSSIPILAVEDFDVDQAYDDLDIVYRRTEYRVEHYHYHRWSAPPGRLVADALRDAYASTGRFAAVHRGWSASTSAVLRGRIVALEEIDRSATEWVGHIVLELELIDAETEEPLWSDRFDITRSLPEQSPAGLAEAISAALAEVVERTTSPLAAAVRAAACGRPSTERPSITRR